MSLLKAEVSIQGDRRGITRGRLVASTDPADNSSSIDWEGNSGVVRGQIQTFDLSLACSLARWSRSWL